MSPPYRPTPLRSAFVLLGLVTAPLFAEEGPAPHELRLETLSLPGLHEAARIRRDGRDVPHVFALVEHDALFMLGYVHAADRFFQMDVARRTFSGTLAELVGQPALFQDIQLRTLGLRRAAERTWDALDPEARAWIEAYVEGVNAWLATTSSPPPEYASLQLTLAGVAPWTAIDTVTVWKGIAFGLSFDLSDLDYTETLLSYETAGAQAGFDGAALFFEDLFRSAPFDPTVSIPHTTSATTSSAAPPTPAKARSPAHLDRRSLDLARALRTRFEAVPALRRALAGRSSFGGSNWWLISGARTESGDPILANDPHLALDVPPIFYQVQMRVRPQPDRPMNVAGVTFPGVPAVVIGCNRRLCWGTTVNPLDVTDIYEEELIVDLDTLTPTHTVWEDRLEPVEVIPQTYLFNPLDPGTTDGLEVAEVGPLEGGLTVVVPRRNQGPIVAVDIADPADIRAISVQYAGWSATHELDAFRRFARARDLDEFRDALESFDVGSQNFAYADTEGNIAYFTSGEVPLREDLETLGAPDGGTPPFLLRDGTHTLRHEWLPRADEDPRQALPFAVLPFAEMPRVTNPPEGFILNANNDPIGITLDNDPLDQLRPTGGLYYLNPGYASGFRAGRIRRLIQEALAGDSRLSLEEAAGIQANHQLLDAEVLLPHLLEAFDDLYPPGGTEPPSPRLREAIDRLRAWDYSTPTGIREGFDPGDDASDLPEPTQAEAASSVAATLYSVWRGQAIRGTIDAALEPYGLFGPGSMLAVSALRNLLDSFPERQGFGASGLDFFPAPGADTREEARDRVLLAALERSLDLLAGDAFATAFDRSTELDDYRWGRLHRIVFDHPLGGDFSIPPGGGLSDLAPALPGVPRSGGFGAVDASSHSARADGSNDFLFGSGASRRTVVRLGPDFPQIFDVLPGGESGVPGRPFRADQLPLWLTHGRAPLTYLPPEVVEASRTFQRFEPVAAAGGVRSP